jgi:hypothetical protein
MPRIEQHTFQNNLSISQIAYKAIEIVNFFVYNNNLKVLTTTTRLSSFWENKIWDPSIAPQTLNRPHAWKNSSIILRKHGPWNIKIISTKQFIPKN